MPIVTISRGSYSRGKDVAEQLARKLHYDCVSREILLEASEEFNIPEISLVRAIHDSPSILERFRHGKERYISYYQYALLKHVQKDNVIYHGLAGQYFLRSIPHVLKVRILASMEDRVKEVMRRDQVSRQDAEHRLRTDDEERRRWGLKLYGIDTWDSRLYDIVLLIDKLTVDDAADLIMETVKKPVFQTTAEAQRILDDQVLCAKIHAMLVNFSLMIEVQAHDGVITLCNIGEVLRSDEGLRTKIEGMIKDIEGVKEIEFTEKSCAKRDHVNPFYNIG
ncbi:Cytidylate kinase, Cmk2 [Desulfobulbus propionicus DSM 2032]|jgi:cytidylate kinase|uniref:Cytidylate kinase, Cmk2 n=1 Tax=Desulfobulbus propionicus (strain ATCC 33891 / DSM 2032 / VKM B-1956 / 1pr3) TaxID=577650 RepID=A0A7U4DP57_DESPD|nr:cytidylate kinase-like family protein [Desulfobulbus propionicus]ADW17791.1 Cytidylate kinase, Cmk2 [Desulfobulbus propionicus DSM 2032]